MKKPSANLFNLISFIALALIATLMLVGGIFRGSLFGNILETGEKTLRDIEAFMRIFFPTFFLIVGKMLVLLSGMPVLISVIQAIQSYG